MLHLAFSWLFILLHRPFYRRSRPVPGLQKDIDHVKVNSGCLCKSWETTDSFMDQICDKAARNIMELLAAWRKLYTLRYVPVTTAGVVFSAGTVFLLSALQTSPGARTARAFSQSLAQADLCVEYLLESGKSFQCANDIAEILRNLLQQELTARSRESPTIASSTIHREIAEMPDSPHASPTSRGAQAVFDNPVPFSQPPTQEPHDGWSPPGRIHVDPVDPAIPPEDQVIHEAYWAYVTTLPPSNGVSTSCQDVYDFGKAMEFSGSMYLEDELGSQLVVSGGAHSELTNEMEALLQAFTANNALYPME